MIPEIGKVGLHWLHQKTDLEVGKGLKHKGILSNILTSVFISVEPRTDYHCVQKGLETNHRVYTSGDTDTSTFKWCSTDGGNLSVSDRKIRLRITFYVW